MRSSAKRAVMSCPRSCARRRAGANSCVRRGGPFAAMRRVSVRSRSRSPTPSPRPTTLDTEADVEAETEEPGRAPTPEFEFDAERITDAGGGRRRWLSEAKRQLEQHRWENPDPIVRSRVERLLLALRRLEADLSAERAGNEAYEAYRKQGRMRDGRRFGRPPDPYQPPEVPEGKVNMTDPDSRPIPVGFGFVQGYNGQTAVNENQIVLAAEITNLSTDFSQLSPMVNATLEELSARGHHGRQAAAGGSGRRRRLLERAADGRRGQ